ncbi:MULTISPECIES: STAS/SEC14 domain-containing protein [Luteimonas]|uniref:STAS/SEC14 domain-containing protein n=1 Tax=Luteimonas wenzhouensis TaxID=2599615 RepID=A0A5C5TV38_9GAMM|nr:MULTISPECIES: STAS/SEC14 domain-containing protein [Luteimonas]NLW96643.1 STAS/SEC14 domain-containing protein [Xanthomonadaceae bacterium]TWG93147.1 SpoIIAA-like protein [Luteimonas sp. J16]TWT17152.1 STAS/SEC14 domain-containing protein [Luteimonas wenzhouensis]
MHQFHPSADDVIAVTVEGQITSADLQALMDRIEQVLSRHPAMHMFIETRSLGTLELAGFGGHLARAIPLLKELRRFGRIAVVADQAWVRAGTRLESALLPFVSYRVYRPEQRDEALAWVTQG